MQVQGMTGSKLYGRKSGADYTDNQKRFKLFSQAALEALTCLPFSPGEETAVVCNDWHTALLPVLVKVGSAPLPAAASSAAPPFLICAPSRLSGGASSWAGVALCAGRVFAAGPCSGQDIER